MNKECAQFDNNLFALARGELMDSADRQELEEHLNGCAFCEEICEQQKWLSRSFAEMRAASADAPPAQLALQLRAEFEAAQTGRAHWYSTARVAVGCAVLCAVAYMADRVRHQPYRPETKSLAQANIDPDDFVPIASAPPLGNHERVDVYRVRMPLNALVSLGVTNVPSHTGAVLAADIVVGDDGIARGIRVLSLEKGEPQ